MNINKKNQGGAAKKPNSIVHNTLTVVGIAMCVILIPILLINCWLILQGFISSTVPNFGGMVPQIVLSNSMYPTIEAGDIIICKQADPEDVEVGDVISFFDPAGNGMTVVTHRVVEITEEEGQVAWLTKGDNNTSEDRLLATADSLVAEYHGIRIPNLGRVAMFMQSTPGLLLCVVLPLALLVGYDMIRRKFYEQSTNAELRKELEQLKAQKAAADSANAGQ